MGGIVTERGETIQGLSAIDLVPYSLFPVMQKRVFRRRRAGFGVAAPRMVVNTGQKSKPVTAKSVVVQQVKPLEVPARPTTSIEHSNTIVLVKFPTRERPNRFISTFGSWHSTRSLSSTKFLISIDEDDATMNNSAMLGKLKTFTNTEVNVGSSKSKVEAINTGLQDQKFDLLVLASDDMIPVFSGWDGRIVRDNFQFFPGFDGAVHYPDGYRSDIITMSILGFNIYRQFGYVYHPEYKSLWCDNEFTHVVQQLGKYQFIDQVLFKHEHPFNTKGARDHLYFRNDALFMRDKKVYESRLTQNFDTQQPQLSILIPSLNSRSDLLERLLKSLYEQLFKLIDRWSVEIRVITDNGEMSVGDKRNQLMGKAQGRYVAFIDDDDTVSDRYLKDLTSAILEGSPDCVSFKGLMTVDGHNPKEFWFSTKYPLAAEGDGVYLRSPNHLCAVRSDIAKSVRFPAVNFGEDSSYAASIKPLLKREVSIDRILYYYRFSREGTATQK